MNICFLTRHNPYDKHAWSGIAFQMFTHLKLYHDVEWIGDTHLNFFEKFFLKIYNIVFGNYKIGFWYYNHLHSKINVYRIQKKIKRNSYDVIFAPNAPDYIAYLETDVPIVYLHDATFQLFLNFYPSFFNMRKKRLKEGHSIEQNAIQKSNNIIYSSHWAAESAFEYYHADKNKISIIDFGPNLPFEPLKSELPTYISNDDEVCQLLFIGIDWNRKGGETVLKIASELKKAGFKYKLTIVGSEYRLQEDTDQIVVVPFLSKHKKEEYDKLYKIYLESHLLLLPTEADCTPVVFCEAAAFGIPVISRNVGGIASVIHEGVNGFLMQATATEIDYANTIISIFRDKRRYNRLRITSRNEFETRLSWKIWVKKVNEILQKLINRH